MLFADRPCVPELYPGTYLTVEGTAGAYHGKPALWNPRYLIEPGA